MNVKRLPILFLAIAVQLLMLGQVGAFAITGNPPNGLTLPSGTQISPDKSPFYVMVLNNEPNPITVRINATVIPEYMSDYIKVIIPKTTLTLPAKNSSVTPQEKVPIGIKIAPNTPSGEYTVKIIVSKVVHANGVKVVPALTLTGKIYVVGTKAYLKVIVSDNAGNPVNARILVYQVSQNGDRNIIYDSEKQVSTVTIPVPPVGGNVKGYYVIAYSGNMKLADKYITDVTPDSTKTVILTAKTVSIYITNPIYEAGTLSFKYSIRVPKGITYSGADIYVEILKNGTVVKTFDAGKVTLVGNDNFAIQNAPVNIPVSGLKGGVYTLKVEVKYGGQVFAVAEKQFTVITPTGGSSFTKTDIEVLGITAVVILTSYAVIESSKNKKKSKKKTRKTR